MTEEEQLARLVQLEREAKRDAILRGRLDVLAEVLGYNPEPLHLHMQGHVGRHSTTMTLAFRGAGKTSNITVPLAVSHLIRNSEVRIAIVSRTTEFAKDILGEIKAHLEENAELRAMFGEFRGPTWNKEELVIAQRRFPDKTPSLFAVGLDGQAIGYHFDICLIDDLVHDHNARTRKMRDATHTWLMNSLLPALDPVVRGTERRVRSNRPYAGDPSPRPGELHFLGTRYHPDDLYGRLWRDGFFGEGQVCRVPIVDDRGRSAWPERFPVQVLAQIRRTRGPIAWNMQYLCTVEGTQGDIFHPDWIRRDGFPEADALRIAMGFDPATSDKPGSCDSAIVSVAVDESGILWVLGGKSIKLPTINQQEDLIRRWFTHYNPTVIGIEKNGYQVMLGRHITSLDPTIPVRQIHTSLDKRSRALQLQPLVESGRLRFGPGADAVVEQLLRFPTKPDDLVDALGMAIASIRLWGADDTVEDDDYGIF